MWIYSWTSYRKIQLKRLIFEPKTLPGACATVRLARSFDLETAVGHVPVSGLISSVAGSGVAMSTSALSAEPL